MALHKVKRSLLIAAHHLGAGSQTVDFYRSVYDIEYDFGEIDEAVRDYELSEDEKKGEVLIPVTQGFNRNSYCVLAHAFRTRGYEPIIPLCDADLDVCTQRGKMNDPDDVATCEMCNHHGNHLLETFDLNPIPLSHFLSNSYSVPAIDAFDDYRELEYRDIPVHQYAKASTRQFLLQRTIDFSDAYEDEVYRRFLRAGIKIVDVCTHLLRECDIRATLGYHAAYIYAGLYLAVSAANDVPAYGICKGYDDQTLVLGNVATREPLPWYADSAVLERRLSTPLTETEQITIEEKMQGRVDRTEIRRQKGVDPSVSLGDVDYERVLGLFPSLGYDDKYEKGKDLFSSTYEWIDATIAHIRDNPDVLLVIKSHPMETVMGTNEYIVNALRDRYDKIPPNVMLLAPDTDVDAYELINQLDAGIVYTSTIGLETTYFGTPTIVVGDAAYRDLGFTYDPETVTEYQEYLANVADFEITPSMHERVKRFAHLLLVEKHVDFPFYATPEKGTGVIDLPVRHEDIEPGNDIFDTIVENAVNNEPILDPESRLAKRVSGSK